MKRLTLFLFFFVSICGVFAQNISVKSFKALPMDLTASSLEGKRTDQNGEVAALIKVVTTETGFVFEGGTLGIVDTKQTPGEVWVWVPRASRKITIKHPKLGVLRDYRYPIEIEAERTYEMVLTLAKIETIIKEAVRQQYLVFELEPKNATLEVNDQLWSVDANGTALQFVDLGTYTYRVRAANCEADAGVVTVDDPDPDHPKIVKVKLKSNLAEVTLKVNADAEIWVNNDKKGVRSWTGSLSKGIYKIECKQEGHETSMVSKEITAETNGQTITLPAPKPIYGSLNVESTPIGATIYIDGKEIGRTPRYINEFLVGQHELRLSKEGYKDYVETVVVAKGQRKEVRTTMMVDYSAPMAVKPKLSDNRQAKITINIGYSPENTGDFGDFQGFHVGAATNFNFIKDIGFDTGIQFRMNMNSDAYQVLIDVPVLINYSFNINDNFAVSPFAGSMFSFAVFGKDSWYGDCYGEDGYLKRFNLSGVLGANVKYANFNLYGGYRLGLLNLLKYESAWRIKSTATFTAFGFFVGLGFTI